MKITVNGQIYDKVTMNDLGLVSIKAKTLFVPANWSTRASVRSLTLKDINLNRTPPNPNIVSTNFIGNDSIGLFALENLEDVPKMKSYRYSLDDGATVGSYLLASPSSVSATCLYRVNANGSIQSELDSGCRVVVDFGTAITFKDTNRNGTPEPVLAS